jgi:hypothetical protein
MVLYRHDFLCIIQQLCVTVEYFGKQKNKRTLKQQAIGTVPGATSRYCPMNSKRG